MPKIARTLASHQISPSLRSACQRRRRRLLRALGEAVAVIPTASEVRRNADTNYPYRWDSNFYYLTGLREPGAVLVLVGGKTPRSLLFCREREPERELWEGVRLGPRRAPARLGVEGAYPLEQLDQHLLELLNHCPTLYTTLGQDCSWDTRVLGWLQRLRAEQRGGRAAPQRLQEVRALLDEMRVIKDKEELSTMRAAAAISVLAHRRAMHAARPGRYEYEVEAELLCAFRQGGADAPAYPSIVAGGANACVLHYINNDQLLRAGSMLLIDAGCEYGGYAADITRTFPVSGKFNPAQRDLYQLVLAAQSAALECVAPGRPLDAYHQAAVRVLAEGLVHYKLCRGSAQSVIESGAYRKFYMHRTGHWLGQDVHDVGATLHKGRARRLEPGMVLTVEPGLYVRSGPEVPRPFRNIGIRIEDDVQVTAKGAVQLTADAPRTVAEIEAWMAEREPSA